MERLSRLCHRIIWMNPLVGDNVDTPPSTLGMLAAGPFIDVLESGHDLASLESFRCRIGSDRLIPMSCLLRGWKQ